MPGAQDKTRVYARRSCVSPRYVASGPPRKPPPQPNRNHMLARRGAAALARRGPRARRLSNFHPLAQHVDRPDNKVETPFDFTPENHIRAEHILGKYPANYRASGIIPLLDLAQRQHGGWLPVAAMDKVAALVGVASRPTSQEPASDGRVYSDDYFDERKRKRPSSASLMPSFALMTTPKYFARPFVGAEKL